MDTPAAFGSVVATLAPTKGALYSASWTTHALRLGSDTTEQRWLLAAAQGRYAVFVAVPSDMEPAHDDTEQLRLPCEKYTGMSEKYTGKANITCLEWCPCSGAETILTIASGGFVEIIQVIKKDSGKVEPTSLWLRLRDWLGVQTAGGSPL